MRNKHMEVRPLDAHEIAITSGGGIPLHTPESHRYHFGVGPFGTVQWDVIRWALIPNSGGPGVEAGDA